MRHTTALLWIVLLITVFAVIADGIPQPPKPVPPDGIPQPPKPVPPTIST
ncbi:MAG: hypothetical protein ABIK67_06610 [candidate division WOR-3 bacterium]